jgi:hypothetical protein
VLRRNSTISKQVVDADNQTRATSSNRALPLRLAVLVADGDAPDFQLEQFKATLYGLVYLLRDKLSAVESVPCF